MVCLVLEFRNFGIFGICGNFGLGDGVFSFGNFGIFGSVWNLGIFGIGRRCV